MLNLLISLIYFLIALGVIVLVHELGHLYFAKKYDVYCHEFSIGMGPKIYHIGQDRAGTIYSIRAIPLGGYVMMAGEDNNQAQDSEIDANKLLSNKKPYQKFLILIAGAVMNFILALILLMCIGFFSGVTDASSNVVDVIDGYPAQLAGITSNSTIVSIDGVNVSNFEEISTQLTQDEDTVLVSTLDFNGVSKDINIVKNDEGKIGIEPTKHKFKFFQSIKYGVVAFFGLMYSIVATLQMLAGPAAGVSDLSGPLGIFTMSSDVLDSGVRAAVMWIAYLSVNIGFINLLPVPALDGGRLIFVYYEMIFRKKANKKFEEYVTIGGVLLLLCLFVYVTFNDVIRTFFT